MAERVVVVVHGVGDPQPGDALTGLVNAYCVVAGGTVEGPLVVERRKDPLHPQADAQGVIPLFPVHRLQASLPSACGAARSTPFHEVYWGDLSRLKGTVLGLVEGTVDLVFGLRHVVFAAQRELAAAAAQVQIAKAPATVIASSTSALWLARGPVLALNILGAIASLLYVGMGLLPKEATAGIDVALTAVAAGALLTLLLGTIAFATAQRSNWSTTTAESMAALGAVAWAVALLASDRYRNYMQFAQDLTAGLSLFAGLLALSVVVLLLASLVTAIAFDDRVRYPEPLRRTGRRALVVIDSCTLLSCALFVFLIMLGWAVVAQQLEGATHADLRERIAQGLHLFGLVWLSFLSIGVVYGGLVLRAWWLKRRPPSLRTRFPRFIVHRYAVVVLVASGIVWAALFLPLVFRLECKHFVHQDDRLCTALAGSEAYKGTVAMVERLNPIGVVLSGALVSLLLAGRAQIGVALDIVLDVISHFKRPERSAPRILRELPHRMPSPAEGRMYTWSHIVQPEHSEWNSMIGRFRDVVESAVRTHQCSELVVIAHSQGTMIALEALGVITIDRTDRHSSARRVSLTAECTIHLVTMGCPLSDLYVHYFPAKYRIGTRASSLVASWRNVHRADDFVGTGVHNPGDPAFPRNIAVGPRGHVDYWLDSEVLEALKPVLS